MCAQQRPQPAIWPTLLGRDTELATVRDVVRAATRRPTTALVVGPPGSGCTSVLRNVATYAVSAGLAAFAGFSLTRATRPYGTLLAPVLDPAPGSTAFSNPDRTAAHDLTDLAQAAWRDPGSHRLALVERYADVINAIAGTRRVAVFIDDLQAADAASLETLPLLARRLAGSRWVMAVHVALGRDAPDRTAVGALIDADLPTDTVRVCLGRLPDKHLAELVRQAVGLRPGEQLLASIAHHLGAAAGLPRPTYRLATALRRAGRLRRIDGIDGVLGARDPIALSGDDPLVAQVGRVDSPATLVAHLIAVLEPITPAGLFEVSSRLDLDVVEVARRVDHLLASGLVRLGASERLTFAVPAVAHAVIATTPDRARAHHRMATLLLSHAQDLSPDDRRVLADHLSVALTRAGPYPSELTAPGVAATLLAETIAGAQDDTDPIRLDRWSGALLAVLAPRRSRAAKSGAPTLGAQTAAALPDAIARIRRLGYLSTAAATGARALALLGEDGVPHRGAIRVETALALADRGELKAATDLLAGLTPDEVAAAGQSARAAAVFTLAGRPDRARGLLAAAGHSPQPAVACERVLLEAAYGDRAAWTEAVTLWSAAHPNGSAAINHERIRDMLAYGDWEAARSTLVPTAAGPAVTLADAWLDGRWDQVLAMATHLILASTCTPPAHTITAARALAAEVWLQRGHPRRALRWVRVVPDGRAAGPVAAWAMSGALHGSGEATAAHALGTAALAHHLHRGQLNGLDLLLARVIEQRLQAADEHGAQEAYGQLCEVAQAVGSRQAEIRRLHSRVRLCGDVDAAEQALALASAGPTVFACAQLHLLLGELGREPETHLREAHALVHALKAKPWQRRVATALKAHNLSLPRRRTASSTLTLSERQVAELVATGLGNRQIASRLWISEKTVEGLLTRILAKSGYRNRVELAVRYREALDLSDAAA